MPRYREHGIMTFSRVRSAGNRTEHADALDSPVHRNGVSACCTTYTTKQWQYVDTPPSRVRKRDGKWVQGNSQSARFGPCQCLPGGDSAAPSASPLPQPAPTCSRMHILIYPWYAAAMRPASRRAGRRPEVEGGGQSSAHTRQSGTWASDGKRTHVQGDGKASGACKCRVVHAQLATVLGTVDAVASAKVCGHKACRCLYSASLK